MATPREMRLCFESELAGVILENAHYFSYAVKKVSASIVKLLKHPQNVNFLSENTILNDDILQQLYSNTHFGVLGKAMDFCLSQPVFLKKMIDACQGKQTELPKIIHLHQIFMQYLFDKLPFQSEKAEQSILKDKLVKIIFVNNELFKKPRIKINPTGGSLTTQVGIAGNVKCSKTSETDLHQNIIGMFSVNPDSHWGKMIKEKGLPFVAGPSGHTGSSILLGVCVSELSEEELKEYLAAVLAVLVAGGYHTMDEVAAVANLTGIPYQPGKSHLFLPKEFLCSPEILELADRYPELLNKTELFGLFPQPKAYPFLFEMSEAAGHGLIRGTSNLVEAVAIKKHFSPKSAYVLNQLVYYLFFLGMKYTQHFLLSEEDAVDTALSDMRQLMMVNAFFEDLSLLCSNSNSLQKHIANTLPFGVYTYLKWHQPISAVASIAASYACQKATEQLGKWFFELPSSHAVIDTNVVVRSNEPSSRKSKSKLKEQIENGSKKEFTNRQLR